MRTGFLEFLRRRQRPIIAGAIVLAVLQAFVAGLATAQVAAIQTDVDAGVICHGAGNSDPETAPGQQRHSCCDFCIAAAPAVLLHVQHVPARRTLEIARSSSIAARDAIPPIWRAVRAGPSQAPPSLA